jgi:hypothetical protein
MMWFLEKKNNRHHCYASIMYTLSSFQRSSLWIVASALVSAVATYLYVGIRRKPANVCMKSALKVFIIVASSSFCLQHILLANNLDVFSPTEELCNVDSSLKFQSDPY